MRVPRIPVTAIVLTYNEATNVESCLKAMVRLDEIIVIDSFSTDDTLERVRRTRPDAGVFSNPFKDFGDQRNWALDNTEPKHDWILLVDADEYCTSELLDEIAAFVRTPGDATGAFIAAKNYFLGRWLKHSTLYPSYQLRLLKLGAVRYRKEGHGQKEVTDKPLAYLKNGWIHYAFSKGLYQWIARHNRYSTDEIELILSLRRQAIGWAELFGLDPIVRRRALKRLGARVPFRPLVQFFYLYVLRGGFLDGYAGFIFCMLRFSHGVHIVAKLAEKAYLDHPSTVVDTPPYPPVGGPPVWPGDTVPLDLKDGRRI